MPGTSVAVYFLLGKADMFTLYTSLMAYEAGFNADWARDGNSISITVRDMNHNEGESSTGKSQKVANITAKIQPENVQFTFIVYRPYKQMNVENGYNSNWHISGNQIIVTIPDLFEDHGPSNRGNSRMVAHMQQSVGNVVVQLSAYRY